MVVRARNARISTGALPELPPRDDGSHDEVQEAVEETKSTVERSLERIRESRETLAESLKPIEELLAERGLDAD